jgi:hypothetical protein
MSIVDKPTTAAQSLRKEEDKALLQAAKHYLSFTKEEYQKRVDDLEAIGLAIIEEEEKKIHDEGKRSIRRVRGKGWKVYSNNRPVRRDHRGMLY